MFNSIKSYHTVAHFPTKLNYFIPNLIWIDCSVEEKGYDLFGVNRFEYHPTRYLFEIKINNFDTLLCDCDRIYNELEVLHQFVQKTFSDNSLKGCINNFINEAVNVEKYYQHLKDDIAHKYSRILFERDTVLRNNHYEDNVKSSNLYYKYLIKKLKAIEIIENFLKALSVEIDALKREINEGQLICLKDK